MFTGRYEHTVDSKGRVALPSKFREVLASSFAEDRLIVTSFLDPCLIAYPVSEWRALEERIRALPRFDPNVVQIKRMLISGAVECSIDGNGRVLIPPVLRQFAGLDRDVVWAGMVDSIEIWSKDSWERMFEKARANIAALGAALGQLGL